MFFHKNFYKKHFPGLHDQESHGRRFGGIDTDSPINKIEDGEERGEYLRNQENKEWRQSLTQAESGALYRYTDYNTYTEVNDHLRKNTPASPEIQTMIANMDSALAKSKGAPEDMLVYRKFDGSYELFSDPSSFLDKGYVSTTVDADIRGIGGNIHLTIAIPKGSPGAYIAPLSDKAYELEWLLPRNSSFQVLSKGWEEGDFHVILKYQGIQKKQKNMFFQGASQ